MLEEQQRRPVEEERGRGGAVEGYVGIQTRELGGCLRPIMHRVHTSVILLVQRLPSKRCTLLHIYRKREFVIQRTSIEGIFWETYLSCASFKREREKRQLCRRDCM